MQKKIVKTIIHSVRDSDIHMPNNSTQDTWDWLLQCAEANCLLVNHLKMLEKIKILMIIVLNIKFKFLARKILERLRNRVLNRTINNPKAQANSV
jgi:hypothetical protein